MGDTDSTTSAAPEAVSASHEEDALRLLGLAARIARGEGDDETACYKESSVLAAAQVHATLAVAEEMRRARRSGASSARKAVQA